MEPAQPPALLICSHPMALVYPVIQTVRLAPEAHSTNAARVRLHALSSHLADAFLHALDPSSWTRPRRAARPAMDCAPRAPALVPTRA